jgi:hypothetical protein
VCAGEPSSFSVSPDPPKIGADLIVIVEIIEEGTTADVLVKVVPLLKEDEGGHSPQLAHSQLSATAPFSDPSVICPRPSASLEK